MLGNKSYLVSRLVVVNKHNWRIWVRKPREISDKRMNSQRVTTLCGCGFSLAFTVQVKSIEICQGSLLSLVEKKVLKVLWLKEDGTDITLPEKHCDINCRKVFGAFILKRVRGKLTAQICQFSLS